MRTISYPFAKEKLASIMDEVVADHAPVVITRESAPSVVMLSLDDYEAMKETTYLFSSPLNAQRLVNSIHALERGRGRGA